MLLFALVSGTQNAGIGQADGTEAPDIILLLADGMDYGDHSCYGQAAHTPHLDQLAQAGTRFTRFYSASAVCTPRRTAILTGKYPLA